MNAEWQRIKEVFQRALDLDPQERRAFVMSACAGDETLQAEVMSLIQQGEMADMFTGESVEEPQSSALPEWQSADSEPASLLGNRYQLLSRIGVGGMGEVYLAHDSILERRVAAKVVRTDLKGDHSSAQRLRREALAAAALDHPFICKVYEIGQSESALFIIMEYVEGDTLQALAKRGPLSLRRIIEIANELVHALEEAHRRGIIHRDLKPSNVMLTSQGHVKLLDFGVAKQIGIAASAANALGGGTLTSPGVRLGTPAYMSPEQVVGAPLDARSDIFSLGVVLYELATCRHPFKRNNSVETMASIMRDPPLAGTRDAESLPGFGVLLNRMIAKNRADRPQTVHELMIELEALRDQAWARTITSSEKAEQPEVTPLVGREAETTELTRVLTRMLSGQGGIVLIGGEPGVGKTRLAQELLQEARHRGCICLVGHCYEMEGAPPFVPFIEMTEQAVRLSRQEVRAAMSDHAPEIASIVPSLRRTYPDIQPLPEVPAGQQRRVFFNAYLEYIQQYAYESPIVALFDDLHWGDEATLQLLLHLAAHLPSMRLLIIGTYRDSELEVNRSFAQTLATLLRQRLPTRINLRRLNESSVEKMLSGMSRSVPPQGLAHTVFLETDGNPFFVEEVFQHLAEEGKLFDESGAWRTDVNLDKIDVPDSVKMVVGRRLDRLDKNAHTLLTAAAMIGRTFPIDLVFAVIDMTEGEALDAIEEADRAQLLAEEEGGRTARYMFVHELIRTTLVGRLSLPRRQRLHLRIADALERLRSSVIDSYASVIAHHLYHAGSAADVRRTGKFLLLAGSRAIGAGAFEEALTGFDRATKLELADDDVLMAQVYEQRGAALFGLQQPDEAAAAHERALTLYGLHHDDAGIERVARAAASNYGWRYRLSDATAVLTKALQSLSENAARERASLQPYLALCRFSPTSLQETWKDVDEAVTTAERLGDTAVLGRALLAKSQLHRMFAEPAAAVEAGRRALSLLEPGAVWDRAEILCFVELALFDGGRFREIDRLLSELETTAKRAGHLGALFSHDRLLHGCEVMRTGDLAKYLDKSEKALLAPAQWTLLTRSAVAVNRLYLGQIQEALDEFNAIAAAESADYFVRGLPEANLFCANSLAGDVDRSRDLFKSVQPHLPTTPSRHLLGAWFALQASVTGLALINDRARCGALYPMTLAYLEGGATISGLTVGPGSPQLAAAIAADAAGLPEKAREHFENATRVARDMPFRILQPTIQYWYGRMLSTQGDALEQTRGRAMIQSAAGDFHALGMVLHAKLAEGLLKT